MNEFDATDSSPAEPAPEPRRGRRERLADWVWERHANPWSGWSRVVTLPILMYGIYARKPRVVAAVLVFTVVNPVLFAPPDDDEAWMTQVVLGERLYYRHRDGRRPIDLLNYVNGPVTAYAVVAAYRRQALRTALFTALSMATKVLFVGYVARYYREHREEYPEDAPAFVREGSSAD